MHTNCMYHDVDEVVDLIMNVFQFVRDRRPGGRDP